MSEFSTELLKNLFRLLVTEAGGVVPAGVALGVTHQRVTQLQSTHDKARPTFEDIWTLERFINRSVVFETLARMVEDDGAPKKDALEEACDVTEAAAHLLSLVRSGTANERDISAAVLAVQNEALDVPRAVRRVA